MRSEKRQTAINLVAKIISHVTSLGISFLLTPYLVSKIGKEAYSFYPMANNFINYMGVIAIALNSMASRFITISLTKGERQKANQYFFSILISNIILSAILLIPMIGIVVYLDKILDIPIDIVLQVKVLFALVFISMIVNLLTNVFGVAVFSQNRLDLGSVCEVTVAVARVLLYLILFLCFKPNLIFVGVVSLAVAILTVIIQFCITRQLLPFMKYSWKFFNWASIKEIISSGVWNSVNEIGTVLLSTVGLMLCNILYGASEAGDYSIALTIPQCLNGVVSVVSAVFLPGLTIKYAQGNKENLIRHLNSAQQVMGIIINIPIAVFMAVGVNFFSLWMPTVDPLKLQRLSVLTTGYIFVTSVMWPISNMNMVMNRVKIPALVMLGTGFINIILVLAFYRYTSFGMYSIPLTQLILFVLNRCVFIGFYSARTLDVKAYTLYRPLVKSLCGAGLIYLISCGFNKVMNPTSWIGLLLECAILGIIGLGINIMIQLNTSGRNELIDNIKLRIRSLH